jgi:hypothetical protein
MLLAIWDWIVLSIGKIRWPSKRYISQADQEKIRSMLVDNYFIILTYRRNHLSSFFIGLANFFLTGKWAKWTHALMNLEDSVQNLQDFRIVPLDRKIELTARERVLIESIGQGSVVSPFEKVFDVHAVALLKPKNMTLEDWRSIMDNAKKQLGKPYDTLFNLADDKRLSCVELVRTILMGLPDYEVRFRRFEDLIQKRKNLTPQMFYECDDFEVVFEVRV